MLLMDSALVDMDNMTPYFAIQLKKKPELLALVFPHIWVPSLQINAFDIGFLTKLMKNMSTPLFLLACSSHVVSRQMLPGI